MNQTETTPGATEDRAPGAPEITLGRHTYKVVPQPHARIFRRFPEVIQSAGGLQTGGGSLDGAADLVVALGDKVWEAVRIFVPDLMSRREFNGLDPETGEPTDEAENMAPTVPQMIDAFDTFIEVNGGKRLADLLGKLLGPEMSRAVQRMVAAQVSTALRKSQPQSGESA